MKAPALLVLLSTSLLAGCLRSSQPLLSRTDPVAALPDATLLIDSEGAPALYAFDGSEYVVQAGDGRYATLRFAALPGSSDLLVVQAMENRSTYYFGLVDVSGDAMTFHLFDDYEMAVDLGITPPQGSDEAAATLTASDTEFLMSYLSAVEDRLPEAQTSEYRIVDWDDEAERARAEAEVAAWVASQEEEASEDAPTNSGAWIVEDGVDPMTDQRSIMVASHPRPGTSVPDAVLGFYCNDNGFNVQIEVGQPLRNMFPDGEPPFADVAIRVDDRPLERLGWQITTNPTAMTNPNAAAGALAQLGQGFIEGLLGADNPILMVWTPGQFRDVLAGGERLLVQIEAAYGERILLDFDLQGFDAAMRIMPGNCR